MTGKAVSPAPEGVVARSGAADNDNKVSQRLATFVILLREEYNIKKGCSKGAFFIGQQAPLVNVIVSRIESQNG
jgi:hypothetical protein